MSSRRRGGTARVVRLRDRRAFVLRAPAPIVDVAHTRRFVYVTDGAGKVLRRPAPR